MKNFKNFDLKQCKKILLLRKDFIKACRIILQETEAIVATNEEGEPDAEKYPVPGKIYYCSMFMLPNLMRIFIALPITASTIFCRN